MPKLETLNDFIGEIVRWYGADHHGFKTMFDAAVAHVKPLPEDTDPKVAFDWKGKRIGDLCAFFKDWFAWMPSVETGLDFIQKFSWLYYENPYGLVFVTTGPGFQMTKDFVELRGRYMDSEASRPTVDAWIEALGPAKMAEFEVPAGGFRDFNAFFIREVKAGQRPTAAPDDPSVVVAPADCVINMIVDDLTETTPIPVKSVTMNVKTLLGGSAHAERFIGGTAVSCILMPDMYHRFHSPVAGAVVESKEDVAGTCFGIKDFPDLLDKGDVGYGYDYSVFEHFRRGYLIIETPEHGHVGMVPVGLNTIGSVVFKPGFRRAIDRRVPIAKGQEIGHFKYGGSLNILLFEPGRFPSLSMLQGQRIGLLSS